MLPSCEKVDEHNILPHRQYRSRCRHCVVCRKVGKRRVASEEESRALAMNIIDYHGHGV